jgi:putative DNA primase/helicase
VMVISSAAWRGPVQGQACELLAQAEAHDDEGEQGALADTKHFLEELLANGPLPTSDIKAEAGNAGFSWPTVRRAKKALGIKAFKSGMREGWHWRLSSHGEMRPVDVAKMLNCSEDAQHERMSTFGEVEHLRYGPDLVEVEI